MDDFSKAAPAGSRVPRALTCSLLLAILLAFAHHLVQACAACGCGAGGYYYGLMPLYHKNMAGVRLRSAGFSNLDYKIPLDKTVQHFTVVEGWLRLYPTRRVQVLAFLPYMSATATTGPGTKSPKSQSISGIADALILGNYQVYSTLSDPTAGWLRHSLFLGGGAKLPTGHYAAAEGNASGIGATNNFQLGTGSLDGVLSTTWMVRAGKAGLSVDGTYKLSGRNRDGYRYGNKLTANVSFYRIWQFAVGTQTMGLVPSLGAYYERTTQNEKGNTLISNTGGSLLAGTAGADVYLDRLAAGVSYQLPIAQHLAGGTLHADGRWVVHLSVMVF